MNRAALDGPATKSWWQDWRGECCAIVASGPSTTKADVEKLRGRLHVIAIKSNVDLCPWADVVYGCDAHWWQSRQGLPKFPGVKLAYDRAVDFPNLHKIEIDRSPDGDRILTDKPGLVGSGGNSGYQALNLAVQFGALGVLLVGFDMKSDGNSPHWYGRNDWPGCANPDPSNYARWAASFTAAAPRLRELGVDVVNASPRSVLAAFRKATIDEALAGWGL